MKTSTERICLDHITIVLQRPRFPENIGAAARAMRNMGIRRMIIVEPENYDISRVLKMATHVAADVVQEIQTARDLREALSPFHMVVGTTARLGGEREVVQSPSHIASRLISLSQENTIVIVFGPEDRGLSNEDLRLCHELVNIPTAEFSSLNLAQAVMVICYELFTAGRPLTEPNAPRLATRHELDGMYDQLRDILKPAKICLIVKPVPAHIERFVTPTLDRVEIPYRRCLRKRIIQNQLMLYADEIDHLALESIINAGRKLDNAVIPPVVCLCPCRIDDRNRS